MSPLIKNGVRLCCTDVTSFNASPAAAIEANACNHAIGRHSENLSSKSEALDNNSRVLRGFSRFMLGATRLILKMYVVIWEASNMHTSIHYALPPPSGPSMAHKSVSTSTEGDPGELQSGRWDFLEWVGSCWLLLSQPQFMRSGTFYPVPKLSEVHQDNDCPPLRPGEYRTARAYRDSIDGGYSLRSISTAIKAQYLDMNASKDASSYRSITAGQSPNVLLRNASQQGKKCGYPDMSGSGTYTSCLH